MATRRSANSSRVTFQPTSSGTARFSYWSGEPIEPRYASDLDEAAKRLAKLAARAEQIAGTLEGL